MRGWSRDHTSHATFSGDQPVRRAGDGGLSGVPPPANRLQKGTKQERTFSRLLVGIAFLAGLFHVSVLVIVGVLGSFGDSPIAGRLM